MANAPEGKTFVKAMADLPKDQWRPICSHWGITGGDFAETIGPALLRDFDLTFIQTRFSFISTPDDPFGRAVFQRAKSLFPNAIRTSHDIKAPTGFIHAHDLTRLLIAAVEQVGLTGDIRADRRRVRDALEGLRNPVKGLIKTYRKPFSPYDASHPDAHEALSIEDFVMAQYGHHGEALLIPGGGARP